VLLSAPVPLDVIPNVSAFLSSAIPAAAGVRHRQRDAHGITEEITRPRTTLDALADRARRHGEQIRKLAGHAGRRR